jgi:CheY-like chemotaxis protein
VTCAPAFPIIIHPEAMNHTTGGAAEGGGDAALAREQAARARAERDSRTKDRLLALLVHELRNPLTAVRNGVTILRLQPGAGPAAARTLDQLDRQSQQLVRLLEELLDLSQLLQGRLALAKEAVDLAQAVGQAEVALRPVFAAQDVRFGVALPAGPLIVEADPARLQQVLRALLLRAAKSTPAGGSVRLAVEREPAGVAVRVRDTGFGITPDVLAHFFELGEDEAEGGHRPGAAGIGLLLARGLAALHGGSVEVASAGQGQGSELVARLPLSAAGPTPAARPDAVGRAGREVRVLCVDDDPDIAEALAQLLRDLGHEVRVAHGGAEALALAEGYRPEVVLLDIGLPDMDGYEVARRLRRQPGLEATRLVAVSGYGREEDRRQSRAAGIEHHLVKPVKAADLERVLAPGGGG